MQRGCGVHRKPVFEIAALQFFTFFIHLSRMGGLVVHGARECLFQRERERNRHAGKDKEKVSVNSSNICPFFPSCSWFMYACIYCLVDFWVL
jgi:hypothetical protein